MITLHTDTPHTDPERRQYEIEGTKENVRQDMLDYLDSDNNGASLLGPNPDLSDESIRFAASLYKKYVWPKAGEGGEDVFQSCLDAVHEFINRTFLGTQKQKDDRFNAATHLFRIKFVAVLSIETAVKPSVLPSADDVPHEYN